MASPRMALIFLSLVLFILPSASISQTIHTPDEQPRKVKKEPKNVYQRWLDEDAIWIASEEERDAFKKLKTNQEREQFIKIFWGVRDPDPDTEQNEYREEHYERIAYANEHFTSGRPGWLTDRGRIYIKFGKPDEIETHPSGGQYHRPGYEGGGAISAYPFEKWFYRYLAGVGSGIEIEFVDPTGSGEYRLARNPNEKNALANVSGLRPVPEATYTREQDSPFSIQRLHYDLNKAPDVPRNYARSTTGSPVIDDNPIGFDVRVDFFKRGDRQVVTAFTVQIENKELSFEDSGGLQVARANITGLVFGVTDRRVGQFEDSVSATATVAELTDAKDRKSAYSRAVVLEPGRYRVDVFVRDVRTGATGIRRVGFEVPKYEPDKLATSSIVLAAKLESMAGQPAVGQFVIGETKVVPNMSGVFKLGQPVGVYFQIYNAGIDQTTLRPSVDVEYTLKKEARIINKQSEDWAGVGSTADRLIVTRLINTQNFTPGQYELAINVSDRVNGKSLESSVKFTVVK